MTKGAAGEAYRQASSSPAATASRICDPASPAALGLRARGDDFLIVVQAGKEKIMTKRRTVLIAASLATLLAVFASTQRARADIFQWEYINPTYPGRGKQQSTMFAPDGGGVNAVPAANLSNLNLTKAFLAGSLLFDANLSSATLAHADFSTGSINFFDVSQGLTTYLTGANLSQANLTNADFSGFDQYGPEGEYYPYMGASLEGANLSGADTRGANFYLVTWNGADTSNMILSHGHIAGLDLTAGAPLVVRDYDGYADFADIVVEHDLAMDAAGALRLVFDADAWGSTISFAPGIPVARGGTLELSFAPGVDVAAQSGRTIDLFDWSGVSPAGIFTVASPYAWNLTKLYTTGEVTLLPTADFNADGQVSAADFGALTANLGLASGATPAQGDANRDGAVNGTDFLAWQRQLGMVVAPVPTTSVPEPGSIVLAAVAAIAASRPRRMEDDGHSAPPAWP